MQQIDDLEILKRKVDPLVDLEKIAEYNLKTKFIDNPCRGVFVGLNTTGTDTQMIVFLGGRSNSSKNRQYVIKEKSGHKYVDIEEAIQEKNSDKSNRFYRPMQSLGNIHVIGNGTQVDFEDGKRGVIGHLESGILMLDVQEIYKNEKNFDFSIDQIKDIFKSWHCEPDAPYFTPRITAILDQKNPKVVYFSIISADPFAKNAWINQAQFLNKGPLDIVTPELINETNKSTGLNNKQFPSNRSLFEKCLEEGFGYCVTTYNPGDSKNLPSFTGEPFILQTELSIMGTINYLKNNLDSRIVAIAGKTVSSGGYLIHPPINLFKG